MAGSKRFKTPKDVDAYMEECVQMEPLALQEEFVRMSADYAYWNECSAEAFKHWQELKSKREEVYATRLKDVREDLQFELDSDPNKKGKVTVSEVESAVLTDTYYRDAKAAEIAAEAEKVRLVGYLEALRTKRDMLISLGAHQRAEMDSGLSSAG